MRVLCKEQRTDEWFAARRGKITASAAKYALARVGGKGRNNYIEKLVADLEGVPDFEQEDNPPWFVDGIYYEAWARGWYQWKTDNVLELTGFVVHDDYSWIGCSPDALIGDQGLFETKWRKSLKTWYQGSALLENAPVMPQTQTQMFVTGRRWCDYVNYWRSDDHEKEKGMIKRIERDDAYIENTLLPAFVGLWAEVQELLTEHQRGYTPASRAD